MRRGFTLTEILVALLVAVLGIIPLLNLNTLSRRRGQQGESYALAQLEGPLRGRDRRQRVEQSAPGGDEPEHLSCGITLVGKRAVVPPGVRIGRNCKIMPEVTAEDFPPGTLVPSGSTVEHRTRRLATAGVSGSD